METQNVLFPALRRYIQLTVVLVICIGTVLPFYYVA